jgi:hypothetical protein
VKLTSFDTFYELLAASARAHQCAGAIGEAYGQDSNYFASAAKDCKMADDALARYLQDVCGVASDAIKRAHTYRANIADLKAQIAALESKALSDDDAK